MEDKYIGVSFEQPIDGDTYVRVDEILHFLNNQEYKWNITISETHPIQEEEIQNGDLFEEITIISGPDLMALLKNNEYYAIFLTLRAFPSSSTDEQMMNTTIHNLDDFINSSCEFYFTLFDGGYMAILTKYPSLLQQAHQHVSKLGYTNIKNINKSDNWYLE